MQEQAQDRKSKVKTDTKNITVLVLVLFCSSLQQVMLYERKRIVGMREGGLTFREISRRVGRPHTTIKRIWRDSQREDLKVRRRGSRRPRATQS